MALQQNAEGEWLIESAADLSAAVEAIEERQQAVRDLESEMEEQFDYLTMKEEITELENALKGAMTRFDQKHIFRDNYKITLIRGHSTTWNPDKLRKLLPKNLWLKVTKQVIDPGKIDDLVRAGTIKEKAVAPALEQKPKAPYIQRYEYKEGEDKDAAMEEEKAARAALSASDAEKGKPAKRGRKS